MTAKDKSLLITASTDKDSSDFGYLLRCILQQNNGQLVTAAIKTRKDKDWSAPGAFSLFTLPESVDLNRFGPPATLSEERLHWILRRLYFARLKKLPARIADFASQNGVTKVVSLLDHPATIWLTRRVAQILNVHYSTYAAAVPETMMLFAGYDHKSSRQMTHEFVDTLKASSHPAFSSTEMKLEYEKRHKITAISIEAPMIETSGRINSASNIAIGCLLNPLYLNYIRYFIQALQASSFQVRGKNITLKLFGSLTGTSFGFDAKPADVEIHSGYSEEQQAEKLSECDVNFIPFWNSPTFSLSCRLNLPQGMHTYLSARRPLLVHTLQPSAVESLVNTYKIGEVLTDCAVEGLPTLERVLKSNENEEIKENYQRLEKERFSNATFRTNLAQLMWN